MTPRLIALTAADPGARDWAGRVAALTRAAFAARERMSGLPSPDGASDDAAAVYADLGAGTTIWLALDPAGELVGALRVHLHGTGAWEISRVAVAPSVRGGGVVGALVVAAEEGAARRGVARVRLNAVVERCLPPIYARMGYRVVAAEPNPDKPLSELVMERVPGTPRVAELLPTGWQWPRPYPTVTWFQAGEVTLAVTGRHDSVAGAAADGADQLLHLGDVRFAGVDAAVGDSGAGEIEPEITEYRCPRTAVPGHLMPRAVDPARFAMWRCAPGLEIPTASLHTRTRVSSLRTSVKEMRP